jgi:predicted Zn-dependent peptidase
MEFHGLGLDYLEHYKDMIYSITPKRIQAAAQKYLDPDRYALAVAGPNT